MTVAFRSLVTKSKKPVKGKRGEPGRFVTLKSGRVIFIPKGKRTKWADVKDKIGIRPMYKLRDGTPVYKVRGGEDVPDDVREEVRRGDLHLGLVVYDPEDNTWLIAASKEYGFQTHADMSELVFGAKGRLPMLWEFDTKMARGVWDAYDNVLAIYDSTREIRETLERQGEPIKGRRLAMAARATRDKARANPFTSRGREPARGKLGRKAGVPYIREEAFTWEEIKAEIARGGEKP